MGVDMNKSKQGFTLIELLVVIAIIGILATTLAPKLREQLAKGKDAKVIAALGVGRTALNVISFEKVVNGDTNSNTITYDELDVESSLVFLHRDYKHQDKKMLAKKVYVGVSKTYNNLSMIESGLKLGDLIITEGFSQVVNGTLINIK